MQVEYHGDVPKKWWDFGDYSGSLNSWPILIGMCIPVGTDGTNGFVFESRVCSCTKTIGLSVLLFFLHGINGMMNGPSLRCFCWYQAATLPGLDRKVKPEANMETKTRFFVFGYGNCQGFQVKFLLWFPSCWSISFVGVRPDSRSFLRLATIST